MGDFQHAAEHPLAQASAGGGKLKSRLGEPGLKAPVPGV